MGPTDPMGPQAFLDELTAWATSPPRDAEIATARKEFFSRTGEIFDDDKQFQMRLAAFLEFFLFDRPLAGSSRTPAQEYYALALEAGPPERAAAFRCFTETVHGLFELRALTPEGARVRELSAWLDFDVTERRMLTGLQKGDVFEARLLSFAGQAWFSTAFCYHPRAAFDLIRKEARRRRKVEQAGSPQALAWECAQLSLKADRYRNIAIERIYSFGPAADQRRSSSSR